MEQNDISNRLQIVNSYASTINDSLMVINDSISTVNSFTDKVHNIATLWADIEIEIHKLDLQFDGYIAKLHSDLEMYKAKMPILQKTFEDLSDKIDKILDRALDMEANTEIELKVKLKLLETLDKQTNQLTALIIKSL